MSAPAEICDSCGKTITDEDLETGQAISVLGRSFCAACKGEAVKDISIDDLAAAPQPSAKPAAAPPAPKPAAKPPPPPPALKASAPEAPRGKAYADTIKAEPAKTPRTLTSQTPRTVLAPAVRKTRGPNPALLAGVAAVVVIAAVAGFFALKGGETKPPKNGDGTTEPRPKGTPADPAAARLAKAEKAYAQILEQAQRPDFDPEAVLAAIERAAPDCAGTPYEAKLAEIREQKTREKETGAASRRLKALLEELRTAVAADPKFARYAELSEKLQKARELALAGAPDQIPELNQLRQDYVGRYETSAEPYAQEIETAAKILADERRYDDALAKIETFPRDLRLSGAWKNLERLRQEIERRKKLFPPKK